MKVLIALLFPLFLYGCFGTDDNRSTSLSGTVADGYIENATVCFDSNGNLACDDNEPTTTTAADGSYSVNASGSIDGLSVIAVIGPDSKDADDGGQTMAEAGKEGFNFMAPAANPTVVSPLSTLVQFEIISNPDFTLDEAQGAVKETLGIDNDNVNLLEYDFVEAAETGDSFATNIKNVTEVLSSALGDVTKNMSDDSAIASLKGGSNDGMKAFQTGIMDMIKETVIPQTVAGGAVTGTVDDLKAQLKGAFRPGDCSGGSDCNTTGSLVSGFQTAVTAKKKAVKVAATAGAQTVSDVKALMENGIIIGYPIDGQTYDGGGTETDAPDDSLYVEYIKMSGEIEYEAEKILVANSSNNNKMEWEDPFQSSYGSINEDDWSMNPTSGMWGFGDIPMDDPSTGGGDSGYGMPTFTKGCMSFGTLSEKICMKERNLAGKTIASVMCPDGTSTGGDDAFCDALDGSSDKFKDGSKGLDVTISYTFDLYRTNIDPCIFNSSASSCSTGYTDVSSNQITSIDDFITKYAAGTHTGYIGNDCNVAFAFDGNNILFKKETAGCSSASVNIASASDSGVESIAYEVKTIGSSKIIITGVPQMHRELNPDDVPIGGKIIFAAVPTHGLGVVDQSTNPSGVGIFKGTFVPLGVSRKYSFDTGKEKIGTYQFLDSVGEALGWEAFPYPTTAYEHVPISYIPGGGGDKAKCDEWLGNPLGLPMSECHGYCMENPSDTITCGNSGAICTKMDALNTAQSGTVSSDELTIWGCD